MNVWTESLGSVAAACTTLCWIPQAVKIVREKKTDGISLATQSIFTLGVGLWAGYGLFIRSWPILVANIVTFLLSLSILLLVIYER